MSPLIERRYRIPFYLQQNKGRPGCRDGPVGRLVRRSTGTSLPVAADSAPNSRFGVRWLCQRFAGGRTPENKAGAELPNTKAGAQLPNTKAGAQLPNTKAGAQLPNTKAGAQLPNSKAGAELPHSKNVPVEEYASRYFFKSSGVSVRRPSISYTLMMA